MKLRLVLLALSALVASRAAAQIAPVAEAPTLADYARRDRAVAAALELPRDTPERMLRTVLSLIDLGAEDVAALVLPELLAAELDDAARAELVREFGSARFLQLIRLDQPAAEGEAAGALAGARAFAQACIDAADSQSRDPGRIAALVAQLSAPTEEERYAARVDLRATGEPGMVAALTALAAVPTTAVRGNVAEAIVQMHPEVNELLVALLAEGRGPARAAAVALASRLQIRAATPWLAAIAVSGDDPEARRAAEAALAGRGLSAPSAGAVQAMLRQRLADLDAEAVIVDDEPLDPWWSWDAKSGAPLAGQFTARQLRALARARLVHALAEAGGLANPADRRTTLVDLLEEAGLLGRELGAGAHQILTDMSPGEVSAALAAAVKQERFAAATRLATELGKRKDLGVLATADGLPSPLAAALMSPVRELRFAALGAVMELAPQRTFPGASYVTEALWYFAAGSGDATAVAAAPIAVRASDWAGQLRGAGFDATPASSGLGALRAAFDRAVSSRLAVVVLDVELSRPEVREVVYQLRANDRTSRVPILVLSSPERFADAERLAAEDPLLFAAPRPQGAGALADLAARTMALTDTPLADDAARTSQAAQALDWIAKLLEGERAAPYDELRRDAALAHRTLLASELAEPSIRVLAALGTADSQAVLADFASATSAPIELRRRAADALAGSLRQFGAQLTSEEILRQYDRYNATSDDADEEQVLGGILDVLESK